MLTKPSLFKTLFIVAIIILVAITAIILWQVATKGGPDITNNVESGSDSSRKCGDDRQCFYQSFLDDCTPAAIQVSDLTIEGDPIITTASIDNSDNRCQIKTTVDGSQDRFGDGKTYEYICRKIVRNKQYLSATDCTGQNASSDTEVFI